MSTPTAPVLHHLMTIRFQTSRTLSEGHPEGTRYLLQVDGGVFELHPPANAPDGPTQGRVLHGADWVVQHQDGSLELDVRAQLEAADGTVVLMSYSGSSVGGAVRSTPRFSTPVVGPLSWLNGLVCLAEGTIGQGGVTYEVWAAQ
ncbi:DUF3237 family protein [Nocardia rhamnosiphila]|uniref:DUF3237 family protein n=1 Tax=Nocardia rhamnosiphila TaxID=426716 RepID=A0ABV2WYP6_9NOCA